MFIQIFLKSGTLPLTPHSKCNLSSQKSDFIQVGGSKCGWSTKCEAFSWVTYTEAKSKTKQEQARKNDLQHLFWVGEASDFIKQWVEYQSYREKNVVHCLNSQEAKTRWVLRAPHLSPFGHTVICKPFISSNSELMSAPQIISLTETRP